MSKSPKAPSPRLSRFGTNVAKLLANDKRHLERAAPTLAEAIKLYAQEMAGDFGAADPVRLAAFADLEGLRRRLLKKINKKGLLIEQVVKNEAGENVTVARENPLLYHLIKLHEKLGYTAQDMVLSKKSRGESAKDIAGARLTAEKHRRLVSAKPLGLPPMRSRVTEAATDVAEGDPDQEPEPAPS